MSASYHIASNEVIEETIVTRSRFICYLFPCDSAGQAKHHVKQLQAEHPQANHHCYAFLAGAPNDSQLYGFSDDGEPSGTAGRPMLATLQGSEIGQVCAVVVRYFGGTKLGTGGLQRAYSASVRNALVHLQSVVKIPMKFRTLSCEYHQVNDVLHLVELTQSSVNSQDYQEKVIFVLAIPEDQLKLFEQQLLTLSAGQLILTKQDS
ncbi:YigZ family protein [Thalassotalea atypica]|uniref:YigZ family protein n=1 Tax=Thalassotalea atypica TaxID=2054316 RepID=UPI0025744917|nr:YigZ family protein [Thalassotalea atypica]